MALLPIQLPPGLERNGSPYESTRAWWDMNLMRWQSGSARPIGGWVRKTQTPLAGAPRRIHTWRDNSDQPATLVGTESKLYVDFGNTWLDITPPGLVPPVNTILGGYGSGPYGMDDYGTPRAEGVSDAFAPQYALWSFANWGEDVLFVSSEDNRVFHYVQATPDTVPVVQTGPPTCNAVGVTDERHVMVVGPTMSGTYYPHRIAWSSRESLTDWDFANPANSAGYLDLQCSSPLNFLVNVKEGMLAFTSTEVFLVRYQSLPYVYGAEKLLEWPVMHPYTIARFSEGKAMWLSPRGIQLYSGGSVQPLPCPVFNDVRIDFNLNWFMVRSHAASNGQFPEVWMFWPSASSSGECDRVLIYNYVENWWGWSYLARSAMVSNGPTRRPLAGTTQGHIYEHENGWTDAGLPLLDQRWLETGALGIGGGERLVDVSQAMLATNGRKQSVKIQFFGRYTPDGDERTFGPYTPRLDGYTDTRVNAREARIRYIGNIDALFEVGLLRLEVGAGSAR